MTRPSFNLQQDDHVWTWVYAHVARDAETESYLLKIAALLFY